MELPVVANVPQLLATAFSDQAIPLASSKVQSAVAIGVFIQPIAPVLLKLSDVGGTASDTAEVTDTVGAATVMVEVSTSVAVALSVVVMVRVAEPAVVLVYFTVAKVALICANVPVSVIVAVPPPAMVALPAVAASVPLVVAVVPVPITNFTVMLPEPMSASDTLSPAKVVATLVSTV